MSDDVKPATDEEIAEWARWQIKWATLSPEIGAKLVARIRSDAARIAKLRARLECDHAWQVDEAGNATRLELDDDDFSTDGIACRDETIKQQEAIIRTLKKNNEHLRAGLGLAALDGCDG